MPGRTTTAPILNIQITPFHWTTVRSNALPWLASNKLGSLDLMSVMSSRKSLLIVGSSALLAATTWAQSPVPKQQSTAASGLSRLRHIIVLAQENRSFDQYFGELRQYWAQNGYPDQSFDGLPQFNPYVGHSAALRAASSRTRLRSRVSSSERLQDRCQQSGRSFFRTAHRVHREHQPLVERSPSGLGR